jgi:Arc/MetJ family transcription regulator
LRTTLNLDDDTMQAAMSLASGRTRTEVVNEALRRFVRSERQQKLLQLRGKFRWEGNIDQLRKRR